MTKQVHNCHVTKTRGAGGTYQDVVPLHWLCHHRFDNARDEVFERHYGRTKESVRDMAAIYHEKWMKEAA